MSKDQKENIAKRNAILHEAELKLRNVLLDLKQQITVANDAVFENPNASDDATRAQLFQLLQDRTTEVAFDHGVFRF